MSRMFAKMIKLDIDKKTIDEYRIGVKVCDLRPLNISKVVSFDKFYAFYINDFEFVLRVDKKSFDKAMVEMSDKDGE